MDSQVWDFGFAEWIEDFKRLTTDAARVNFVLRRATPNFKFIEDLKDDAVAVNLKNRGNVLFGAKKFEGALKFYTRSIAKAKTGAVLAVSYGNRSAVLFHLKLYQECLEDIARTLETGCYPDTSKPKLATRREKAQELIGTVPREPYFEPLPAVSGSPNPNIQSASECVEVQVDERYGRQVVATRDIIIGQAIVVEKPFASTLVSKSYVNCHECTNLCYNPIPCDSCTVALYCDRECKRKALERYHKYECPILASIQNLKELKDHNKCHYFLLILRITLIARESLRGVERDQDTCYRSDRYREIKNLQTGFKSNDWAICFLACEWAAKLFLFLKNHTSFLDDFSGVHNVEDKLKESLLLHHRINKINSSEIAYLNQETLTMFNIKSVGIGLYSFFSLFNHSCHPNVWQFDHGDHKVLRACRNIEKGEQCFVSYGPHYMTEPLSVRKALLYTEYSLTCKCRACEEHWPTFNFSSTNLKPVILDPVFYLKVWKSEALDPKRVKLILGKLYYDFLRLEHLEPHYDVALVVSMLRLSFATLGNKKRLLK